MITIIKIAAMQNAMRHYICSKFSFKFYIDYIVSDHVNIIFAPADFS